MKSKKLKMSFDPHTIEHLGIKMYSVLPNAIAELIANAYDAEATSVHIKLIDDGTREKIIVVDDGNGMSFDEINDCFLRIGRKRRMGKLAYSRNDKRKVTGRKGLGKLAFFGIGDIIDISTCQNGRCVNFTLNWSELINTKKSEYEPKFSLSECDPQKNGTTIELKNLKRKTDFDVDGIAISISKLFHFIDDTFKVFISYNQNAEFLIDNKLRYKNLTPQIIWDFPNTEIENEYLNANHVKGRIIATEKPLKPGLRGIILYAHGRLVNAPEFFGVGESSHGYSYLTGWLDVDFVDELDDDVISTDRQSLSWDLPVIAELQSNLKQLLGVIEKDWRNKRKIKRRENISKKIKVNVGEWVNKLPSDVKTNVENIVTTVIENSELTDEKQNEVVWTLHSLIPEYANYHWRHMHPSVQNASYSDYKNEDFYRAVVETIKRFESEVKNESKLTKDGRNLMLDAFGDKGKLSVAKKYKKPDGKEFSPGTISNIEVGQQHMSAGIMSGVRNPLAHEEIQSLKQSGLFTENDCLDMLSLLSHLFRRLDDAK